MRQPNHFKPLGGAAFALSFTTMLGVGATVIAFRDAQPTFAPLLLPVIASLFALGLQLADLGVLRLAGHERPERFRRLWRRMWTIAPAVGALAGIVIGIFYRVA